jgi:hypothetical protein
MPVVADHLLLLGVDADDRQSALLKAPPHPADVLELLIAMWVGVACQFLVIDAQGELQLLEQTGHCLGGDFTIGLAQLLADL